MRVLELFAFLQLLDFLTTVVGIRLGAQELSPFIRWLMSVGPITGLTLAKFLAFGLAGACLYLKRPRVLVRVNYFFAALVTWNLANILVLASRVVP